MRIAVICDPGETTRARDLAEALRSGGAEATLLEPAVPAPPGRTAELASCLVEIEAELAARPVDAVALVGRGDCSFAGVLVATKARIPAIHLRGGTGGDGIDNDALIDRLADRRAPAGTAEAADAVLRLLDAS